MSKRVLITGARDWKDTHTIHQALYLELDQYLTVVHGDCKEGADRLADIWSEFHADRVTVERHPAKWETYGPAAGPIRNNHMVSLGADICLAFITPSSKGTRQCVAAAEAAGIPTFRYWSIDATSLGN